MRMNHDCRLEFQAEIHSYDTVFGTTFVCDNLNVKESKPICEDLHEMQCYGQHHFAASNDLHEHLRRHSLWKDSMKLEYSKTRSESSECTWKAKAI